MKMVFEGRRRTEGPDRASTPFTGVPFSADDAIVCQLPAAEQGGIATRRDGTGTRLGAGRVVGGEGGRSPALPPRGGKGGWGRVEPRRLPGEGGYVDGGVGEGGVDYGGGFGVDFDEGEAGFADIESGLA